MRAERFGTPPRVEDYSTYDPEPLTSKAPWNTPSPVSYGRRDHGIPEPPSNFLHGYAAWQQPLPDSPPDYRQPRGYQGVGTSHLLAGVGEDTDMGAGGSGIPKEPSNAERLEQVWTLYDHKQQRADRLEQEVEKLRKGKGPGRDPLR